MIYRGHTIEIDKDKDGTEFAFVYLPDADEYGTDPIEMTGGIEEAKAFVDEMIRDGDGFRNHNLDRERFGADH